MDRINKTGRVKRKTRRDLHKIRKEALAVKKLLKKTNSPLKGKSIIVNVLKDFGTRRNEIDKVTHGLHDEKKGGPPVIGDKLLPDISLFRRGYKGDEIKNKDQKSTNNTKKAEFKDNFLQLMNGDKEKTKKFRNELNNIVDEPLQTQSKPNSSNSEVSLVATEDQRRQCKKSETSNSEDLQSYRNKNTFKKRIFSDSPTDEVKDNETNDIMYTRSSNPSDSNRHLIEEKDVNVSEPKSEESGTSISRRSINLSDIQRLKEFGAKIEEAHFSKGLKIEVRSDPLKESMEYLKAKYFKNYSKNISCHKTKGEIEVQALTTESIICNTLFSELQDTEDNSGDKSRFPINVPKPGSSSNSTIKLSPTQISLNDGAKRHRSLLFPSNMFPNPSENVGYYKKNNFITPQGHVADLDVNFSTDSLKSLSLESDDDDQHNKYHNNTHRLKDYRPKTRNNLDGMFEETKNVRQKLPVNQQSHLLTQTTFSPPTLYNKTLEKRADLKKVRYAQKNQGEPTIFKDVNETSQEKHYVQNHPHDYKKVYDLPHKYYKANVNPVQYNKCNFSDSRSSNVRSRSRSNERNFLSKSKTSIREERNRGSKVHKERSHPVYNHVNQCSMKLQQNLPNEKNHACDLNCKASHSKVVCQSSKSNNFLDTILPPSVKELDKPTIVLVMPPVVHMHCDNVDKVPHGTFRMLNQAQCQHPINCTVNNDYKTDPRSVILSEYIESSASNLAQPAKFVAVEEDEQRQKKPVYKSQEDNRLRKDNSHEQYFCEKPLLSKSFCCSNDRMHDVEKIFHNPGHYKQVEANCDYRNQTRLKNKYSFNKSDCCCSENCEMKDEREVRLLKRKQCPQTYEKSRHNCCNHNFGKRQM